MHRTLPRPWLSQYGVAILTVAITVLLWPLVVLYPFLFFWPAVLIAAWYGGFKSGLLAILLTALFVLLVFQSRYLQSPPDTPDFAALVLFILAAGAMSWRTEQTRKREDTLNESEG